MYRLKGFVDVGSTRDVVTSSWCSPSLSFDELNIGTWYTPLVDGRFGEVQVLTRAPSSLNVALVSIP